MTLETHTAHGLMAFWARIDEDYLLTFQQWHNCEHVPERVAIPGFLRGRRYRDIDGAPFFLMYYETTDAACLGSPAYLAALNAPTPWTQQSLTHFREPARNVYTLRQQAGAPNVNAAPYLASIRFNLQTDAQSAWLAHLSQQGFAQAADIPAVNRISLYEVDEATTGIKTSERKIYGDGPGAQQYLIMVEAELPPTHWMTAVEASIRAGLPPGQDFSHRKLDLFWLEFGYTSQNSISKKG